MISLQEENALITLIRRVANTEINARFRRLDPATIQTKTAFDDLVTEADVAVERALTIGVGEIWPGVHVVGEEAVAADPGLLDSIGQQAMTVIIDPIDGTWNYANGLATHGVLISVLHHAETVLGILYDPVVDDWILARKDGGSWFCRPNQTPVRLQVSKPKARRRLRGFLSLFTFPEQHQSDIFRDTLQFSRAHTLRCACHEYRLLIMGQVDFYFGGLAKPWDHSAGALAVQEAGGVVAMQDGRAYSPLIHSGGIIAAHSQETLEQIRDVMNRYL